MKITDNGKIILTSIISAIVMAFFMSPKPVAPSAELIKGLNNGYDVWHWVVTIDDEVWVTESSDRVYRDQDWFNIKTKKKAFNGNGIHPYNLLVTDVGELNNIVREAKMKEKASRVILQAGFSD